LFGQKKPKVWHKNIDLRIECGNVWNIPGMRFGCTFLSPGFAAAILSIRDSEIRDRLDVFRKTQTERILENLDPEKLT
jgi:hypothetical protein